MVFVLALLVAATPVKSVAVLPLKAKNKASKEVSSALDDLLLASVHKHAAGLRVVGPSDVDAALGFEKTKDMMGCDATSCAAEIAGALGVDSIVYGTFTRLGKKYVLTLSWTDQRNSENLGRASETIGTSEDDFDKGVDVVVANLFGKSVKAEPVKITAAALDPNDLASYEPLKGTWYAKDGAIYGMGGSLLFKEQLENAVLTATAELISGPHCAVGFLSRFQPSKTTGAPIDQGYGMNVWMGERKVNVFRGVNNSWPSANPAWQGQWIAMPFLQAQVNRCSFESIGPQHKAACNGQTVYEFVDGSYPRGPVGFMVESGQTLVKFTDIKIERR